MSSSTNDAYDAYDVKSREFNRFDMKQEGEKNVIYCLFYFIFFTQPLHLHVDELFKHL